MHGLMTFQALGVRIAVILAMALVTGLGHHHVLVVAFATVLFAMTACLELLELR